MKKAIKILFAAGLLSLAMGACTKIDFGDDLEHRWILCDHSGTKLTTLTFHDDVIDVENADIEPFSIGESRWNYRLTRDSVLKIWHSEWYDEEDDFGWDNGDYYEMPIHMSRNNTVLTIEYGTPLARNTIVYKFIRR